jgi:inosine-uridine nucleoside N-ribohydrolase
MPQADPERVGSESVTQFDLAPEEEGLPPASELRADELIASLASEHPGEVSLLTIGSMTNVGQALVRFPRETSQLNQIVTNGGNFGRGLETAIGWNLRYDPVAAAVVSRGPVQWVLMPENAMGPAQLTPGDVDRLENSSAPLPQLLFHAIQLWRRNKKEANENSVPHLSDLDVFAYLLGGWLEAYPGLAWITAPPRGRIPELRVDLNEVGPHLLGGVLPKERGGPIREFLMERLLGED